VLTYYHIIYHTKKNNIFSADSLKFSEIFPRKKEKGKEIPPKPKKI
jgi:hypothetical protein